MMNTIHSRTYTNVILTAIALLLLALLARPYLNLPSAFARDITEDQDEDTNGRNEQQSKRIADLNPNADNAAATREVAASNKDIAAALRETAKAQQAIATAIQGLGGSMSGK